MGVEGLVAEVLRLFLAGERDSRHDRFAEHHGAEDEKVQETSEKSAAGNAKDLSPYLSHAVVQNVQKLSLAGSDGAGGDDLQKALQVVVETAICRRLSGDDLKGQETASNVKTSRPDTQAD